MTGPLLTIEDLKVTFSTRNGPVDAIKGVSLSLSAGETLGIVGESGSGKSVTAFSVMQLLDRAGKITGGRITFSGQELNFPITVQSNFRGGDTEITINGVKHRQEELLALLG